MLDEFTRALKNNPSKCLECPEYHWCPNKVWVGEPRECPRDVRVGGGRHKD